MIDDAAAARWPRQKRAISKRGSVNTLGEREAKELLALYGVPVVADRVVTSAAQAADVAEAIGFPVVMKIDSPDVLHKTDIGGVRLDVRDRADAGDAYRDILARVASAAPAARVAGVLVQQMVPRGVEVIVGARHDPQFGSLLLVGLGGIFVELLSDVAVSSVPVSRESATAMLVGLKGAKAFEGARGLPQVDLPRLADVVSRISRMVADMGDDLLELDVNPIICGRNGQVHVVDALVVRRAETAADAAQGEAHEVA